MTPEDINRSEKIIVGWALLYPRRVAEIVPPLTEKDFADQALGKAWDEITRLAAEGKTAKGKTVDIPMLVERGIDPAAVEDALAAFALSLVERFRLEHSIHVWSGTELARMEFEEGEKKKQ